MADSPSQHSSQRDIAAIAQGPTVNNELNTSFHEQPTRRSMLRFSLLTLMAGVTGSALATDVANRAWTRHVTKDARETWKLIAENRTAMYPLNPSQINWHLIHMHDQLRLAGQPRSTVVSDSQYCETLQPHMKSLAYIARTEVNAKDPVMECFRVKELCIPAVLADLPHSALVSEADLKEFAEQTAAFEMSQLIRLEPELSAAAVYHRVQGLEELFAFTRYSPSELGVDLEQLAPIVERATLAAWKETLKDFAAKDPFVEMRFQTFLKLYERSTLPPETFTPDTNREFFVRAFSTAFIADAVKEAANAKQSGQPLTEMVVNLNLLANALSLCPSEQPRYLLEPNAAQKLEALKALPISSSDLDAVLHGKKLPLPEPEFMNEQRSNMWRGRGWI